MKPIVATLLTAAALSVACSSYDSHSAPQAERISFSIAASADMSRTQWGECEEGAYAVKWQPDDRIRVMLSSADNIGTGSIEHISANGLGACFAVDMSLACEPSEYICYACCPESACKDMTSAEDDSQGHVSLAFTVPTRQMPSDKSFDPAAAVIFGRSTAADRMPQVFDMRFTSVVAYGKLTIMDLPKEPDERVVSVTLRASRPLTGQAVYRSGSEMTSVCAEADASNDLEIEYASTDDNVSLWFACIPAALGGGELCVCVKTDRGRYEKLIDLSDKEFSLERNRILSFAVDMGKTQRCDTPIWHRIASPDRIRDGDYIIACGGSYLPNDMFVSTTKHPQAVELGYDVHIESDRLTGSVTEGMRWHLNTEADGFIVSSYGDPSAMLYATNTSDGIYVDAARRLTWRFAVEGGAMRALCRNAQDTRYLGLAGNKWRSYKTFDNINYDSSEITLYGLYVE